ncbi:MAG: ribosome assembly RNA-binding protein YhbY [Proteobacteria bacterium]|nr:ribosome assembly RNA-binding protein YhbY [Pseudomonadota bacterium]MCP4915512.1 ribosome assembly RNA-binding protein YhbY [Pseudomonadota bacterium]
MALTNKQLKHLKALGHHLNAVVQVGNKGVTEAVLAKTSEELDNHELIKLKVGQGTGSSKEVAAALAEGCTAEVVQVLGRTLLLYRRRAEDPEIVLP